TVVHDLGLIAVRGHHGGLEPNARARLTEPLDAVVELAQGRVMVPGLLLPGLVLVGTPDVDLGEQLRRSGQRRDSAALVSRTVRRDTTMLPRYSVPTSVRHRRPLLVHCDRGVRPHDGLAQPVQGYVLLVRVRTERVDQLGVLTCHRTDALVPHRLAIL